MFGLAQPDEGPTCFSIGLDHCFYFLGCHDTTQKKIWAFLAEAYFARITMASVVLARHSPISGTTHERMRISKMNDGNQQLKDDLRLCPTDHTYDHAKYYFVDSTICRV